MHGSVDWKQEEHHRDQLVPFCYRSMDDLVPCAMGGTDFVHLEKVISHTGKGKMGADAYRFKVQSEDGEMFESNWQFCNKSNAYIQYRKDHPELPESTQTPVAGAWRDVPYSSARACGEQACE